MGTLTHWEGEPVAVWAGLWQAPLVEAHDALGSTNDRLKEMAAGGAAPWTVVVAEAQTRGRGRGGAVWHSPAGAGLWISVLLPGADLVPMCLPLLVGVAAARAAEAVAPGARVGIKWPNDLEVGGRKVGGILCEWVHGAAVAGVGINVRASADALPPEVAERATFLEEGGGVRVSKGALATALIDQLRRTPRRGGDQLEEGVHGELDRRDVLRGMCVETARGVGISRGIAPDGALLLEKPEGDVVRVVSGSVRICKEA